MTDLTSKLGETSLIGLDLKIGGGLGAFKVRADGTWRRRETCVEVKRSREDGVSVYCSYKNMDEFAPAQAYIVFNRVGTF